MAAKFFIFTFSVILGFGYIQNAELTFEGYSLWPRNTHMLQMKELKATFQKDSSSSMDDTEEMSSEEMSEMETEKPINSGEERMRSNRVKRDLDAGDISISVSVESKQLDSKEGPKSKRQTSITGNANRLKNLINLPVQLDVLANVLSQLNTGVLDSKPLHVASNTISGNDNIVSSLVNLPIDADAIVNVLSNVNSGSATGGGGLVDGLLGGLLGGGGEAAGAGGLGGLLSGLLAGGDSAGLGHTLEDLLGALLGNNGLLGNVLSGQDGKGLVGGLLNNLLAGVLQLVDKLLQLLVGLLNALLTGMGDASPGASSSGGNNQVNSLINAPIRVNALIDILSTLKQQLIQAMDPSGSHTPSSPAATFPGSGSLKPSSSGLLGSLLGSSSSSGSAGSTIIGGNHNAVSSLLNVAPDLNINLNILSELTGLLGIGDGSSSGSSGGSAASGSFAGGVFQGNNPNEICFDVPLNRAETSITGNNNTISNTIDVRPKIHLDLNLLSSIKQAGQSQTPTQRVCITLPQKPTTAKPATTTKPTIAKPTARPTPAIIIRPVTLAPYTPISLTSKPAIAPIVPTAPSPAGEICFYVWVDQLGTVINGDNNQVKSLINLPINLNLDLNVLGSSKPSEAHKNLVMKQICIPGALQITPTTKPPATKAPATVKPTSSKEQQCFRRTCTKWHHVVDYNCYHKPQEYPIYTITQDAY